MSLADAKALTLNGKALTKLQIGGATVWEAAARDTLGSLAVGSIVHLLEDELTPYIVIAHDHHGEGLTTLFRQTVPSVYDNFNTAQSSTYNNKYNGSILQRRYAEYYASLPEATKAKIVEVGVPTRSYAASGFTIAPIPAHMFPLSRMEYANEGTAEGAYIPYFTDDASRIGREKDGTAKVIWTRSVVGGMENYAHRVSQNGAISSQMLNVNGNLRPACCVRSDAPVTEANGNLRL